MTVVHMAAGLEKVCFTGSPETRTPLDQKH